MIYQPSPERIEAETAKIRESWSQKERHKREYTTPIPVEVYSTTSEEVFGFPSYKAFEQI